MIEAIPTMGRHDTLCGEPAELFLSLNSEINKLCECFVLLMDLYAAQLQYDVAYRREWCGTAG